MSDPSRNTLYEGPWHVVFYIMCRAAMTLRSESLPEVDALGHPEWRPSRVTDGPSDPLGGGVRTQRSRCHRTACTSSSHCCSVPQLQGSTASACPRGLQQLIQGCCCCCWGVAAPADKASDAAAAVQHNGCHNGSITAWQCSTPGGRVAAMQTSNVECDLHLSTHCLWQQFCTRSRLVTSGCLALVALRQQH